MAQFFSAKIGQTAIAISLAAAMSVPVHVLSRAPLVPESGKSFCFASASTEVVFSRPSLPLIDELQVALLGYPDDALRTRAQTVLAVLHQELQQQTNGGLSGWTSRLDGTVAITLALPNRRLTISLDEQPGESGWHIVSKDSSGAFAAYGDEGAIQYSHLLALLQAKPQPLPS